MRAALRAESDRPSARRQRADRAVQLAARARPRRHVRAAHRGHRHRAIDARIGSEHPRRPAVARPRLGRRAGCRRRRTGRTASPSGSSSTTRSPQRLAGATAARTAVSARRSSSTPSGRPRWPRACRRSTAAAAAICRPTRSRRRLAAGEAAAIRFRVPAARDVTFHDSCAAT